MKIEYKIKPLSVNDAWKGKRYKTDLYKNYEKELLLALPQKTLPEPPYRIYFEFGFSSSLSDYDNPVKPLQDIIGKKYGFDDRDIERAVIAKKKVKKGEEYFIVKMENIND
jgi:Holliday junction resolvase RusA-like endonuclease